MFSEVDDIRDAMLEAQAELMEAYSEFMQDISVPQAVQEITKLWVATPEEVKEQFKSVNPDGYAALMRSLFGS